MEEELFERNLEFEKGYSEGYGEGMSGRNNSARNALKNRGIYAYDSWTKGFENGFKDARELKPRKYKPVTVADIEKEKKNSSKDNGQLSLFEIYQELELQRSEMLFEAKLGTVSVESIERAIKNRNYVSFYYNDPNDPNNPLQGARFVEPYVIGQKEDGRTYLRAYMIHDSSKEESTKDKKIAKRKSKSLSGGPGFAKKSGWRLFRVDKMEDFFISKNKFSSYRKYYNDEGDKGMDEILFQLKKDDFPKGENPILSESLILEGIMGFDDFLNS